MSINDVYKKNSENCIFLTLGHTFESFMSGRSFFFILNASWKTGKISMGISQGFYYIFQLFLKLNRPLFWK